MNIETQELHFTEQDVRDAWATHVMNHRARVEGITPEQHMDEIGAFDRGAYFRGLAILAEAEIVQLVSSAPDPLVAAAFAEEYGGIDSPVVMMHAGYRGTIPLTRAVGLRS